MRGVADSRPHPLAGTDHQGQNWIGLQHQFLALRRKALKPSGMEAVIAQQAKYPSFAVTGRKICCILLSV